MDWFAAATCACAFVASTPSHPAGQELQQAVAIQPRRRPGQAMPALPVPAFAKPAQPCAEEPSAEAVHHLHVESSINADSPGRRCLDHHDPVEHETPSGNPDRQIHSTDVRSQSLQTRPQTDHAGFPLQARMRREFEPRPGAPPPRHHASRTGGRRSDLISACFRLSAMLRCLDRRERRRFWRRSFSIACVFAVLLPSRTASSCSQR